MADFKIGDEVYIHGFVDEVRRNTVIIKNEGGYFGTVTEEIMPSAQPDIVRCKDCKWFNDIGCAIGIVDDTDKPSEDDFCSYAERKTDE